MRLRSGLRRLSVHLNPPSSVVSAPSGPILPVHLILNIFDRSLLPLNTPSRLRILLILSRVFAAARSWAQQALVERALISSARALSLLLRTLEARPDLAWSVRRLEVVAVAEGLLVERLLRRSRALEGLSIEGPVLISPVVLSELSRRVPTLIRVHLVDVTLQDQSQRFRLSRRLSKSPQTSYTPLYLASVRHLTLRRTPCSLSLPTTVGTNTISHPLMPSLVSLSLKRPCIDEATLGALLTHAPRLSSLSLGRQQNVHPTLIASSLFRQLKALSIPLLSLPLLLNAGVCLAFLALRLTDGSSTHHCSDEVYYDLLSLPFLTLDGLLPSLRKLVVPSPAERDFFAERAVLSLRSQATTRGIGIVEEQMGSYGMWRDLVEWVETERVTAAERAVEIGLAL